METDAIKLFSRLFLIKRARCGVHFHLGWHSAPSFPRLLLPFPLCATPLKVCRGNIWAESLKTDGFFSLVSGPLETCARRRAGEGAGAVCYCNLMTCCLHFPVCVQGVPVTRPHPVSVQSFSSRVDFPISESSSDSLMLSLGPIIFLVIMIFLLWLSTAKSSSSVMEPEAKFPENRHFSLPSLLLTIIYCLISHRFRINLDFSSAVAISALCRFFLVLRLHTLAPSLFLCFFLLRKKI